MKISARQIILVKKIKAAMKLENSGDNGIQDELSRGDIVDGLNLLVKVLGNLDQAVGGGKKEDGGK